VGERVYDAIVIGAGPAGSRTARNLALQGFDVALLEQHRAVGIPCHCSGLVTPRTLAIATVGDDVIRNVVRGAVIHVPGRAPLRIAGDRPHAYVIDRIELDRRLAQQALSAGAEFVPHTHVTGYSVDQSTSRGTAKVHVSVVREGVVTRMMARVVVGCDGANSRVSRQLRGPESGLIRGINAEADYDGNPFPDHVEVFLDPAAAPGWFGWTIPVAPNVAKIGTGSANGLTPLDSLERLTQAFPKTLGRARMRRRYGGAIAVWRPGEMVGDRVVLVGDAARQAKPLSGGGILGALRGADLASRTLGVALRNDRLDRKSLRMYSTEWSRCYGAELKRQYDMRNAFLRLDLRSASRLLDGIDPVSVRRAVEDVADVDFLSRLAWATFLHNPALFVKVAVWPRYPRAWLSFGDLSSRTTFAS
jgi:digeranylgeranylglycerophospholipid reductase